MMYKIIQGARVIDVVDKPKFVRFLSTGHIANTDKSSAHGIVGSDSKIIYRLTSKINTDNPVVTIAKIDQKEFNKLKSLLNSKQEVYVDESILSRTKQAKIAQLSTECKNRIYAGFSIVLEDKNIHKFKLSAEDQLNLLNLENLYNAGEEFFVYHATDELCDIYSREDISKILKAYRHHVLYHTTYFNAAKHYINSLASLDEINKFTYGTDVAQEHSSATLKSILRNGENI